ncbi:MAG: DUF975 family protein [Oscillospiraceae bacterium]|nr:DUF975 family protein [Oscillospiraceae bacterium]
MIYWDRATLKARAKEVLKKSYWTSLLAALIVGVVTGGLNLTLSYKTSSGELSGVINQYGMSGETIVRSLLPVFSVVAVGAGVFGILYAIFVANIARIGNDRFFTLCRYDRVELEELLFGFKNGRYMDNVKTMFMMDLYIVLWSLLLVVPGIIKALQYCMVPYILAENPNLSTERALELSARMTDGEKGNIFVLALSFIGWYLLGLLACGVGVLFVTPYAEATFAELYGALRYKAVQTGVCDKTELGAEL